LGSIPKTPRKTYKRTNGGTMPFYEFTCDCGHIAEVFFEMNDEKRIICESCKKKLMQRKYSLGGTIFKGEGWGGSK
jgi:putative FmdB family regulatory protein